MPVSCSSLEQVGSSGTALSSNVQGSSMPSPGSKGSVITGDQEPSFEANSFSRCWQRLEYLQHAKCVYLTPWWSLRPSTCKQIDGDWPIFLGGMWWRKHCELVATSLQLVIHSSGSSQSATSMKRNSSVGYVYMCSVIIDTTKNRRVVSVQRDELILQQNIQKIISFISCRKSWKTTRRSFRTIWFIFSLHPWWGGGVI